MGFLAAIPPLVGAAAVSGGAGIGSALLSRGGGRNRELEEAQRRLAETGERFAERTFPWAERYAGQSLDTFSPVIDYYMNLLRGDRQAALSALSPEVEGISQGYEDALRTSRALAPRSGGSSAFFTELPFQRARDVQSLLATARPEAATNLASIATNLGSLGQGYAGAAGGFLGGASQGVGQLLNYGLARRGQNFGFGQSIGRALGPLLKGLFNRANLSGGGAQPPPFGFDLGAYIPSQATGVTPPPAGSNWTTGF